MKSASRFLLCFCAPLMGCSATAPRQESIEARRHLNLLATQLEALSLTRMDAYYIPAHIETPVSITPADLERNFSYRLSFGLTGTQGVSQELSRLIRKLKVYDSKDDVEVRLGLVVYRPDGSRVSSIFFSKDCKKGVVDNISVQFEGRVCSWVESSFSHTF